MVALTKLQSTVTSVGIAFTHANIVLQALLAKA